MKKAKPLRRQIFVLTPEEKKAIACVLAAFLLGLGTMHYRANHPRPAPPQTAKEQRTAKTAATRDKVKSRRPSPTPRPAIASDPDAED